MIKHYMFDSFNHQYSLVEASERSTIIAQAIKDGYPVKWNDYQHYSWAEIEFETDAEAVAFKLRYI